MLPVGVIISFVWRVVSNFLDPGTVFKIRLVNDYDHPDCVSQFDEAQLSSLKADSVDSAPRPALPALLRLDLRPLLAVASTQLRIIPCLTHFSRYAMSPSRWRRSPQGQDDDGSEMGGTPDRGDSISVTGDGGSVSGSVTGSLLGSPRFSSTLELETEASMDLQSIATEETETPSLSVSVSASGQTVEGVKRTPRKSTKEGEAYERARLAFEVEEVGDVDVGLRSWAVVKRDFSVGKVQSKTGILYKKLQVSPS